MLLCLTDLWLIALKVSTTEQDVLCKKISLFSIKFQFTVWNEIVLEKNYKYLLRLFLILNLCFFSEFHNGTISVGCDIFKAVKIFLLKYHVGVRWIKCSGGTYCFYLKVTLSISLADHTVLWPWILHCRWFLMYNFSFQASVVLFVEVIPVSPSLFFFSNSDENLICPNV
jgi:hypothetical protein